MSNAVNENVSGENLTSRPANIPESAGIYLLNVFEIAFAFSPNATIALSLRATDGVTKSLTPPSLASFSAFAIIVVSCVESPLIVRWFTPGMPFRAPRTALFTSSVVLAWRSDMKSNTPFFVSIRPWTMLVTSAANP